MTPEDLGADGRQSRIESMFVLLADTLAEDFDLSDVLDQLAHACVDLLGATAAGILLVNSAEGLQVVASSSENSHLLDVFQLQAQSGPCLDAYSTGAAIAVADLNDSSNRWPEFTNRARALGFRAVHAFPMKLRSEVIGAVNLFHAEPTVLAAGDARVAQALTDIATISVIQMRVLREREHVAEQLQIALNSRVVIEQAKGMLAELGHIDMGRAFEALRRYARDHNLRLTAVAERIVARELQANTVLGPGMRRQPPRNS